MFFEAEFWVAVAFVILLALAWRAGAFDTLMNGLDSRGARVQAELNEARRLREEAAGLLSEYQRRREAADREAADIVASARQEAEQLARDTQERMAEFVRRRTAAAEAKIAQAEAQAAAEVRAAAVDAAIRASETVLRDQLAGPRGEDLVARSLGEVRTRLNA